MPLRRAFTANSTSLATIASFSLPVEKKTRMNCRIAARNIFIGNWSITAPMVPPSTISIAVGWVSWAMLPPSIIKPPRTPDDRKQNTSDAGDVHE
jgi:hypothetical protein